MKSLSWKQKWQNGLFPILCMNKQLKVMCWLSAQTHMYSNQECSATQQFWSCSLEAGQNMKESKAPAAHTKRAEYPEQWATVWPAHTLLNSGCSLWVSTGTKMEWKTLAGHLNLCRHLIYQHGNNNTIKSAMSFYYTFQNFCWSRAL